MPRRPRPLLHYAREMRHEPTRGEARVWLWLRDRKFGDYKFRRQALIPPFIVDFYCAELRLAIEIDGSHHNTFDTHDYDNARTLELTSRGIHIVRISNEQLIRDHVVAGQMIEAAIVERMRVTPSEILLPS